MKEKVHSNCQVNSTVAGLAAGFTYLVSNSSVTFKYQYFYDEALNYAWSNNILDNSGIWNTNSFVLNKFFYLPTEIQPRSTG